MKELLMEAKQEIAELRRENEVLVAQVNVVHIFAAALGLKKGPFPQKVDVAWQLQNAIDRLADNGVPQRTDGY
jgi:hypothetical protein